MPLLLVINYKCIVMLIKNTPSMWKSIGLFVFTLILLTGADFAQAKSCKGMASAACEQEEACSWVNSFTRSDGVKVSAFCRAKPKREPGAKNPEDS